MAEIIKFDRFPPHQLSKEEITRLILEQSIQAMDYHVRRACHDKDQSALESLFDMLTSTRRLLRKIQTDSVTS